MQQRALITGGSSGIGRAYAHYLTGLGWRLDLAAQSEQSSDEHAAAELDGPAHCYPVDLASPDGVQQLISAAPVPDLIIANAGITKVGDRSAPSVKVNPPNCSIYCAVGSSISCSGQPPS